MTRLNDNTRYTRTACGLVLGGAMLLGAFVMAPHDVAAQSAPIVYPSQGQSMQQQGADEGQCRQFAQQNTGFNPAQGPTYYGGSSGGPGDGAMFGGAARGAALGAIGGAIGGDAGKGAAIGAGVGALGGLMRRNQRNRQQEAAQQQAVNDYNSQLATFNRAFATCMQGRGYAVN